MKKLCQTKKGKVTEYITMGNVLSKLRCKDHKSFPMANRRSNTISLVSENPEVEELPESEGLPKNSLESGI